MNARRVRLELTPTCGYEFIVPINNRGRLSTPDWPKLRGFCVVRRFSPGQLDSHGTLIQTRAGSWAFSYDVGDADDEGLPGFDKQVFAIGEMVRVRQHDGVERIFTISDVGRAIERVS